MTPDIDAQILAKFQRQCPLSYKALAGRRYPLPRKYEGSYANQGAELERRQLVLLIAALAAKEESFPFRAELCCLLQGLRCDCPTIFLDPHLAEALSRTQLPADFTTDDVKFPLAWIQAVSLTATSVEHPGYTIRSAVSGHRSGSAE